ncbi:MAG: hypothetical protein IPF54_03275 [Draconibacterium sp.]|nr:hypothetical protein [Draconibacterium sp.]
MAGTALYFDESGFCRKFRLYIFATSLAIYDGRRCCFNNLDYSFYVGKEDGTAGNKAPGGGSTNLRKQLTTLRSFIESLDFVKMKPDFQVVVHSPGSEVQAISTTRSQYAIFLPEMQKNG